jgi:hypothetical protein
MISEPEIGRNIKLKLAFIISPSTIKSIISFSFTHSNHSHLS